MEILEDRKGSFNSKWVGKMIIRRKQVFVVCLK